MNADQLAELEDERRFLLRSLRDLDAELAAGDVDRVDYETLRDGYTRRAADVLRGIEDGKAALPSRRPRRRARAAAVVVGVLVVAAAIGIVAARSSGERTAGDTITGGVPGREDTAALLSRARALLGGDPRLAQDAYALVLDREPDNAEALTYSAWLLYFASARASPDLRDVAVATAQEQLARAVAVDPAYPDPALLPGRHRRRRRRRHGDRPRRGRRLPGERPAGAGPRARRGHVRRRPPTPRRRCPLPADAPPRQRAAVAHLRASPVSSVWRAVHWRTTSSHRPADTMPRMLNAIIIPRLSA